MKNPTQTSSVAVTEAQRQPRIAIFIVAYNAASTLAKVLDRIPLAVRRQVEEVYVIDDASADDTYDRAHDLAQVSGWENLRSLRNRF